MRIVVSNSDGSPIYLQIFRQIQFLVGSGRLRAGEELPSIRSLASQLVVNPNTVARAYRELESAGVVSKRGTAGTFVADNGSTISARQRRETLYKHVEALLKDARQMGFSTKDVLKTVKECDTAINQQLSKSR
jgi:GntR family transcriptional regulator